MPFKLPSKLPFGGGHESDKPKEPKLDDILPTKALRVDLVLLLALCTESMREELKATFARDKDQSNTEYTAALNRDDLWGSRSAETALQDAGIKYLNDWRTGVLRKAGEALAVQSSEVKRQKDIHTAHTGTPHAMLDGRSRDSWLPFDPVATPPSLMRELDDSQRALVLGAVLFILLSLETYPAHSRVLLLFLCECFELSVDVLSSAEATTAITLLKSAENASIDSSAQTDEARLAQAEKSRSGRKWKVGLATVAGAVAIGITGGLAAPIILGAGAAVFGAVGLGGLATLLGATIANPVTIAALFGALGGRMTGRAMEEYAREVEDFKFAPVKPKSDTKEQERHKLRVAIGVSGWIQEENDVIQPWKVFSDAAVEPFGLRYELSAMTNLASMLDTVLKDTAYSVAQAGALKLLLPVLSAAMLPVSLMKAGKFLDNPFTIAMERSDKAGKVLAHALIAKAQGERPVTLVGFSLGAGVVSSCLLELAEQKAFGLIESAVIIGGPVPSDAATWRSLRAMVSGRLINVYATKDFLLGFLYRARNAQLGVAGLQAITNVRGVENKDVTEIVTGHNQYRLAVGRTLRDLHFEDLDISRIEDEEQELEAEKSKEQAVHEEAKRNGLLEGEVDENGQMKMSDTTNMPSQKENAKVSSTMRDLRGLDLSDTAVNGSNKLSTMTARSTKDERPATQPAELPALPPRPRPQQQQLTPDTSDDEHEDTEDPHQPISMMDPEPEAIPDTPPRRSRDQ